LRPLRRNLAFFAIKKVEGRQNSDRLTEISTIINQKSEKKTKKTKKNRTIPLKNGVCSKKNQKIMKNGKKSTTIIKKK
jgi:hypothetical protein